MDDVLIIGAAVVAFLYLAGRNPATSAAAGTTAASTNSLSQALSKLASALTPAKPASGSAGSSGGGGTSGGGVSSAGNTPVSSSTYTPLSTINQLEADGNPSDAQVGAYLAALDVGDTTLADSIIGDIAPVDLMSDANPYAGVIAPVADPGTYQTPPVEYTPPDTLDNGGDLSDGFSDDGYSED